jgi:hypothetical protein
VLSDRHEKAVCTVLDDVPCGKSKAVCERRKSGFRGMSQHILRLTEEKKLPNAIKSKKKPPRKKPGRLFGAFLRN